MNQEEALKELGLTRDSTEKDVKTAYRKASSKHHPDKDGGDEEKFKKIKKAYEILTGKIKPQIDQAAYRAHEEDAWDKAFAEIERRQNQALYNGRDIRSVLPIDMLTALKGGKVEHKINIIIACPSCGGHGFVLKMNANSSNHHISCNGCSGKGQIQKAKVYKIIVPPDAIFGNTLRLKGKGESKRAATGVDGDLYVMIALKEDNYYHIINNRICIVVYISFEVWMLGGVVEVATPSGLVKVNIPAFISESEMLCIKKKGIGNTDIFLSAYLDKTGLSEDVNKKAIKDIMNNIEGNESESLYSNFEKDTIEMANKLKK